MPFPRCALAVLSFALALTLGRAAGAGPLPRKGTPVLPDLVPLADSMRDSFLSFEGGRLLLRFPTVIANLGEGPVQVIGRRARRKGPMLAFQTLFRARNRPLRQVPIGEFEYHPAHSHWHLLAVAQYRLLYPDGSPAAGGQKVSFCLLDTVQYDPARSGSPAAPRYHHCNPSPTARRLRAGISVGWADVYARDLPDQHVDVTGLPPGDYILQCIVDPESRLQELSTEKNVASVPVRLP